MTDFPDRAECDFTVRRPRVSIESREKDDEYEKRRAEQQRRAGLAK